MAISRTSALGWENTLVLSNNLVELIVTEDVGPRIISYRLKGQENVFYTNPDELGHSAESEWKLRGGHRFWIAPECDKTYHKDNHRVSWSKIDDLSLSCTVTQSWLNGTSLEKDLTISLEPSSSRITVTHRVTAPQSLPTPVSAWGLSVMRPGGIAVVPQPTLRRHPNDTGVPDDNVLLPNRRMILWPYTNPADERFTWLPDSLTVAHRADLPATKIGFLHQQGLVSYQLADCHFEKHIPFINDAHYPDHGSNFELYTDGNILELESLSPLHHLSSGDAIIHVERWSLMPR